MKFQASLMWFRRDLRLHDNAALYTALKRSQRVFCAFVFDREILDELPRRADRRVEFIWPHDTARRIAIELYQRAKTA